MCRSKCEYRQQLPGTTKQRVVMQSGSTLRFAAVHAPFVKIAYGCGAKNATY